MLKKFVPVLMVKSKEPKRSSGWKRLRRRVRDVEQKNTTSAISATIKVISKLNITRHLVTHSHTGAKPFQILR